MLFKNRNHFSHGSDAYYLFKSLAGEKTKPQEFK